MHTSEDLRKTLNKIDGRGYRAYKDLKGAYSHSGYTLFIDHVQGDPYAAPSRIRIRVNQEHAGFPDDTFSNRSRETALRDFVTRAFSRSCRKYSGDKGTGNSGSILIDRPGQEILERTSVIVTHKFIEARFFMGMPAFGRKIAGKHAIRMFFNELPEIIKSSLYFNNLNREHLYTHIEVSEDADFLRNRLMEMNTVAFVADGSILPRLSGIDPRPLNTESAVPFKSPESLCIKINLPNRGEISGMGIPAGITLIVGGGYHGKSTLLRAIELGIYNHVPGDGREFVVSNPFSFKIRSEDGRRIEGTCITPFISNLPFGQDTNAFSSDDASGSTSQAANIIEAIEAGAEVLLIDEDTSATNFMIRDFRMQKLVSKDKEPITPFVDKVRSLFLDHGISTILVIGGSGDYFDVADTVICMTDYSPYNVTEESKKISAENKTLRKQEGGNIFGNIIRRVPVAESIDPSRGRREAKISPRGTRSIAFGKDNIDLSCLEQLVDPGQTRAIGEAINYSKKHMRAGNPLNEVIENVMDDIKHNGYDILGKNRGDYAGFRGLELAAAINRLRTLRVKQKL